MDSSCACERRLPDGQELLRRFSGLRADESDCCGFVATAKRLYLHHRSQWDAEDEVRGAYTDDRAVAELKRRIDGMNAARVALVEGLDALVAENVAQAAADTPLHTETIGSVIDRLAIAAIGVEVLRGRCQPGGAEAHRHRFEAAVHQRDELTAAYDTLVREVRTGRRRVSRRVARPAVPRPPWRAAEDARERRADRPSPALPAGGR
jgi:uncharacterized protein DUF4254